MPSNTYKKDAELTSDLLFGDNKLRTAWTIYNNSVNEVFWSNTRQISTDNGFIIPAGGSNGLSKPLGDDTSKEVWIIADGAGSEVRVYEGFG